VPRIWITKHGISSVKKRLVGLKAGAFSLGSALTCEELSKDVLVDIHKYMDELDDHINELHHAIEGYSFKWGRRGRKCIIPVPQSGSTIPVSLIVPVIIDCIGGWRK
jgi:hypothetical protein